MKNIPSRPGRVVSALACDRRVRVLVAVLDGPAEELRLRHELGPEAARLAAEGLVAAALLSSQLKGDERHTVNLYGEQPRFELMVDLWADGRLRARFTPAEIPPTQRFDGLLAVLKFLGNRELYRGLADIRGESIEGALSRYYAQSVQVDARIRVAAGLAPDGRIGFACGILVERLPGMEGEEFAALFDRALGDDLEALMTGFAFGQLGGEEVEVLDHLDLAFRCPCSRERVLGMLKSLGADELATILEEDGRAEVTCHFCNTAYEVQAPELAALLAELGEASGREAH